MDSSWNPKDRHICHDCDCLEGQLHTPGCDVERCPFCGRQLVSCACAYTQLGYAYNRKAPHCGLKVYRNSLSDDDQERWEAVLEEKGRIPHFAYPCQCVRCGELWPTMFHVPDEEWEAVVELGQRHRMLCTDCYALLKHFRGLGRTERGEL